MFEKQVLDVCIEQLYSESSDSGIHLIGCVLIYIV